MTSAVEVPRLNVFGQPLRACSHDPKTGFFRDGCCATSPRDRGKHVVCTRVSEEFLNFSKQRGNDLITARPEYDFPGLTPGDQWCLCAARWREALEAGVAPPVVLEATHQQALEVVDMEDLLRHALDLRE